MFQFKQFSVDQTGCAMKINTDGVLLGAIADADDQKSVLDIGTGTGVIALMVAQRFPDAQVDAVEIDAEAARTAGRNFAASPFADRLHLFPVDFETFFMENPDRRYDLIISNPPFYVDSLKSPGKKKSLAKHADMAFFSMLIESTAGHLTPRGSCWLILPTELVDPVTTLAEANKLSLRRNARVKSYPISNSHRSIITFAFDEGLRDDINMVIYSSKDVYSEEYKNLLKPYFLAF